MNRPAPEPEPWRDPLDRRPRRAFVLFGYFMVRQLDFGDGCSGVLKLTLSPFAYPASPEGDLGQMQLELTPDDPVACQTRMGADSPLDWCFERWNVLSVAPPP